MKRLYLLAMILLPLLASAQPSPWQWAVAAEGWHIDAGIDVKTDINGNIYCVGLFNDSIMIGSDTLASRGYADIIIIKLNNLGQPQWSRRIGGLGDDHLGGISLDGLGHLYVCGSFVDSADFGQDTLFSNGWDDIFISKLDTNGNLMWTRSWGGNSIDRGIEIEVTSLGHVLIAGTFVENVNFDSHTLNAGWTQDVLVMKADTAGNVIWAKNAGATNLSALVSSISSDSIENTYIVGGGTGATMNFDFISTTNTDAYLAKYDSGGVIQWAKPIEALNNNAISGTAVACDADANIYVGGYGTQYESVKIGNTILDEDNAFVAKYGPSGNVIWAKNLGHFSDSRLDAFVIDESNNLCVSGAYNTLGIYGQDTLHGYGDDDILILKMDGNGNHIWATGAGANFNDVALGLTVDDNGHIIATGFAVGPDINFAPLTLSVPSGNGMDMFIAKMSDPTSVRDVSNRNKKLHIFPNPADDLLYITGAVTKTRYSLQNITGAALQQGSLLPGNNRIDISALSPGLYLLHAAGEVHKIVKQ